MPPQHWSKVDHGTPKQQFKNNSDTKNDNWHWEVIIVIYINYQYQYSDTN